MLKKRPTVGLDITPRYKKNEVECCRHTVSLVSLTTNDFNMSSHPTARLKKSIRKCSTDWSKEHMKVEFDNV